MADSQPSPDSAASQRLRQLADLSQRLAEETLDLDALLRVIVEHVGDILGDSCSISLVAADRETLDTVAHYHPDPEVVEFSRRLRIATPQRVGEGLGGRVAATGQPLFIPIAPADVKQLKLPPQYAAYVELFRPHSYILVPLRSRGSILGVVGVSRDRTPQAYTEDDFVFIQEIADRAALTIENALLYRRLRDANADLTAQVAERSAANARLADEVVEHQRLESALREAMAAAEAANLAKSEFLSRMSHELRTPLNAILGFTQVLQMEVANADQLASLGHIYNGGHHLLTLINEVLDLARIEAGHLALSPEPVLVQPVLLEAIAIIRPLAAGRSIAISADLESIGSRTIIVDRQRLKQVLLNVLSNAVKYNRDHGQIRITGTLNGERVHLRVADTGIGIPAGRLDGLFVPFERLGQEHTAVEGTGLGLALSKRLVEAMDGTIAASSVAGQGSTFTLEFPLAAEPAAPDSSQGGPADALPMFQQLAERRGLVLLIEDNLANLRLIERLLGPAPGIRLLAAMQGQLGIDLAREHRPALILLDLHLPDMHGEDVLQRLLAEPETREIPVMVITADATARQAERLLASGARAYLTKPIDVPAFLQTVTDMLPL